MRQAERKERSKREILQAATEEFGTHGYEGVTMEGICLHHGISKGMMYHYFASKDAVFLFCIQSVFCQLKEYIEQEADKFITPKDILEQVQNYFLLREYFFQLYPMQKHIFENAMFRAPKHLKSAIQELRKPLREMNRNFLRQLIPNLALRSAVSENEAVRYFESLEYVFWEFLAQYNMGEKNSGWYDIHTEAKRLLNMFIFGIAKQTEANQ